MPPSRTDHAVLSGGDLATVTSSFSSSHYFPMNEWRQEIMVKTEQLSGYLAGGLCLATESLVIQMWSADRLGGTFLSATVLQQYLKVLFLLV